MLHEGALARVPRVPVSLVDPVHLAAAGDADVRMGQAELARRPVEREAVRAVPRGVHERGGGPVHHVARRQLLGAGSEGGRRGRRLAVRGADAEDGADRAVDVEIGRAVDGIRAHHHRARAHRVRHLDRLRRLLRDDRRAHAGLAERGHRDLVAPHVHLLDLVAGEVGPAHRAETTAQGRVRELLRDLDREAPEALDDDGDALVGGRGGGLRPREMFR